MYRKSCKHFIPYTGIDSRIVPHKVHSYRRKQCVSKARNRQFLEALALKTRIHTFWKSSTHGDFQLQQLAGLDAGFLAAAAAVRQEHGVCDHTPQDLGRRGPGRPRAATDSFAQKALRGLGGVV